MLGTHGHWAVRVLYRATPTATRDIRLKWSSPSTRDSHTYCRGLSSGTVTTRFYGFKHPKSLTTVSLILITLLIVLLIGCIGNWRFSEALKCFTFLVAVSSINLLEICLRIWLFANYSDRLTWLHVYVQEIDGCMDQRTSIINIVPCH